MSPIDFDTKGVGPYGAIPKDTVDYCDGPLFMSISQSDRYLTRWAAWQASDGIRLARLDSVTLPTGLFGTLSGLFDGETVGKLSLCFEQNAKPVIAVERSGGVIEVRRFVGASPTSFLFNGKSPLMFYNGVLVPVSGNADAVCFYLNAAGTQLLMRVQRDNFATEYVVGQGWATPLTALHKVDRIESKVYVWGYRQASNRKDSRQVVISSQQYGFWPLHETEATTTGVSFASGAHNLAVIGTTGLLDSGVYSVGFSSGAYQSVVVGGVGADAGNISLGLQSGAYVQVVIVVSGQDFGQLAVGLQSGQYLSVVIPGIVPSEAGSQAIGFLSGIYAAA